MPLGLLVVIWAAGSYVRVARLDRPTLKPDELTHLFAAQALARGGTPLLPSGSEYRRGIDYTRLARRSLARVAPTERAIRLPSAILGSLCLAGLAAIAWTLLGPWAAVCATLLYAFDPTTIGLSRFGRFYTLQLAAGLVALYAGWRTVREAGALAVPTRRALIGQWMWCVATGLALVYALRIQVTTLPSVAAWGLCLAFAAGLDARRRGVTMWRTSVPLQACLVSLVATVTLLVARPGLLDSLALQLNAAPYWARASTGGRSLTAYYQIVSGNEPLLAALAPVAFLLVALRDVRLGAYLVAWFGIPLVAHSFAVFTGERFIILAMPALFLAVGHALAAGATRVRATIEQGLIDTRLSPPARRAAVNGTVAAVALVTVAMLPSFNSARKTLRPPVSEGWAEALAIIQASPELARLPWGSATPLAALLYWGRVDFAVQKGLRETWIPRSASEPADSSTDAGPFRWAPMGAPDPYAGVPVLTTPEAIQDRLAPARAALVGIDERYFTFDNVERSLRQELASHATELCQGRCGSMRLYHYQWAAVR